MLFFFFISIKINTRKNCYNLFKKKKKKKKTVKFQVHSCDQWKGWVAQMFGHMCKQNSCILEPWMQLFWMYSSHILWWLGHLASDHLPGLAGLLKLLLILSLSSLTILVFSPQCHISTQQGSLWVCAVTGPQRGINVVVVVKQCSDLQCRACSVGLPEGQTPALAYFW